MGLSNRAIHSRCPEAGRSNDDAWQPPSATSTLAAAEAAKVAQASMAASAAQVASFAIVLSRSSVAFTSATKSAAELAGDSAGGQRELGVLLAVELPAEVLSSVATAGFGEHRAPLDLSLANPIPFAIAAAAGLRGSWLGVSGAIARL